MNYYYYYWTTDYSPITTIIISTLSCYYFFFHLGVCLSLPHLLLQTLFNSLSFTTVFKSPSFCLKKTQRLPLETEVKFSPERFNISSNMAKVDRVEQHSKDGDAENETPQPHTDDHNSDEEDTSLSLSSLSKLILPPLGASTYNHSHIKSRGWIISPMDSRYRYALSYVLLLQ